MADGANYGPTTPSQRVLQRALERAHLQEKINTWRKKIAIWEPQQRGDASPYRKWLEEHESMYLALPSHLHSTDASLLSREEIFAVSN